MRTKTFLLLGLFMGIALAQLSAQPDNHNGTGAVVFKFGSDMVLAIGIPVLCGDQDMNFLVGDCKVHWVDHWKMGNWLSFTAVIHGEVTGKDGEVFKINEVFKTTDVTKSPWIMTWHSNLIGNNGSHYLMYFTWDDTNGIWTVNKAECF
jgi:hypothetical protein